MTRPKQNPRTFRGASNLELEVDLAPKNTTVENEREIRAALPGRRGIHRTPEALHPIWKVSSRGLPRPPLRNPACSQYSSVSRHGSPAQPLFGQSWSPDRGARGRGNLSAGPPSVVS